MLYLIHGGGDTAISWSTVGRANAILDNLLAEKKAVPMTNGLAVIEKFKSQGVRIGTRETPGGHTWENWRLSLYEVAPKLFR